MPETSFTETPRPALLAILSAILSSSVLTGICTTLITNYYQDQRSQTESVRQNMAALVKLASADLRDDPAAAATYSGILLEQKLVPSDFSCRIIGLELFSGKQKGISAIDVVNSVRSAVSPDTIEAALNRWPCDVKTIGAADRSEEKSGPVVTPAEVLECPTGQLYTQFGTEQQSTLGRSCAIDLAGCCRAPASRRQKWSQTTILPTWWYGTSSKTWKPMPGGGSRF